MAWWMIPSGVGDNQVQQFLRAPPPPPAGLAGGGAAGQGVGRDPHSDADPPEDPVQCNPPEPGQRRERRVPVIAEDGPALQVARHDIVRDTGGIEPRTARRGKTLADEGRRGQPRQGQYGHHAPFPWAPWNASPIATPDTLTAAPAGGAHKPWAPVHIAVNAFFAIATA
jgi:hypothetical protein